MSYRSRLMLFMAVGVVGVAILGLWPKVQERFAPEPFQAWVAIEVEGSGHARVGKVEIPSGQSFILHAVLEARGRDGEQVFYTDAESLYIDGNEISAEALRSWNGRKVNVLWFTVEGATPVLFLEEGESMSRFQYREFLRLEWGTGWSASGSMNPAHDQHLTESSLLDPEPFGTQRFHVRIELMDKATDLVPSERYSSWGASDLLERLETFPAVVARHPGGAAHASEFFGLSEIVPADDGNDETMVVLASLTQKGIAYSGLTLLRDLVKAGGGPEWRLLDLAGEPVWGDDVREGDLLRVGSRFVVLFADEGERDILDGEDRVLDFHFGPKVARLGEVFEGEGGLEWAPLGRPESGS